MKILLVGCGNMGGAMLARWQAGDIKNTYKFTIVTSINQQPTTSNLTPDIIVFAVKPQTLADILPEYKTRFGVSPLYISIAAGKTINFFAERLGEDAKIIRAMPNTPALVGKAITALCASENVNDAQRQTATKLMEAFGKALWVEEKNMDAVTAISGSGPAYLFLFLEALTKAGVSVGLEENIAKELAVATVHGSIHLVEKSTEKTGNDFETLRKNVTSKGGTTQSALEVLMHENALEKLLQQAVQAAVKRAKELA